MNPRLFMLAIGVAAGYVLGTRAGRERYDAMKAAVLGVWQEPRVAKVRSDVDAFARAQAPIIRARAEAAAKAAPAVVADVARDVGGKVTATAKDVANKTTAAAKDVAGKVSVAATDVREKAASVTADLRDRGETIVERAVASVGQAREDAMDVLEDDEGEER